MAGIIGIHLIGVTATSAGDGTLGTVITGDGVGILGTDPIGATDGMHGMEMDIMVLDGAAITTTTGAGMALAEEM